MGRPRIFKNHRKVSTRLSERDISLLQKIADKKETSLSDQIRIAVKNFLLNK